MGEDLDKYEITPSDLGQDPELDEGVLEEAVASGSEPKQPISPCFEKIPFKNRQIYRKMYDAIEIKDMSFEDFAIELHFTQSPAMMQRDLGRIMEKKQQGNRRMAADLHNINKHLN